MMMIIETLFTNAAWDWIIKKNKKKEKRKEKKSKLH